MSHEKLDVLLSEINRQIDLASKSSQNIPASSYQSAGELFIQNQDHSYYHDLEDWCLTLAPNDKTNWEDIVLPPNCRNCLWKLLAFSNSSSAVIDPEYQQARCRDLQAVQRRGDLDDGQTEDIWQAAGLLSWATSAESSMVIVQGTSQTTRCLEQFSYEISHQLAEIYPTIWMLSETSSREFFAERDETELLRQLAVQALRQISCFKAGFLVDSLHLFKECRTNHDWFQILLTIVQLIPKLYVVLDLSILEGRINDAKNWAHDFHTLISQLKSGCSSKLSVMLLSSRPLSRGNSSAPVISVTSQSRQLSRPRPRKRPFENSSTGSIRCLSTLLSMREMQETRRKRKLVSSPRVERETHDPTFQASASIYSLRGVDVPGDTRPSRQDHDPSKGTLNSIISTGTSPTPPHRNDITIAIICALPLEADAVLSTFDHHWDIQLFSRMEGDKNAYSVGRIGCHDVVLVHMPGMGRTPAATVTASCRTSFPGIRLALVVGICGAVPFHRRSTEVLLGDVIISDRLVIYDFGRQFPDKFMRKEETNDNARKPPEEIMGFLSKIKGQMHLGILHDRAGIHLEALLQSGSPPHPGLKEDRLFESSYRHKHQTPSECVQCASLGPLDRAVCDTARTSTCDTLGCDLTKLVVRQRHSHIMSGVRNRLPVIHFGAYASGDTVMKSGEHRDQIAAKEEIIAFEMEGAGAWEIFPCIIIKGVCDYADSHKNKKWQGYAAVTAAACLKALLEVWQPAIRRATHSDP